MLQEVQRRKDAEEAAGVEKVDVFGRHIKAKRVDGSYRAMDSADKVSAMAMMCAQQATSTMSSRAKT